MVDSEQTRVFWSYLLLHIYQSCDPPSHRAMQVLQLDLETLKKQVAAASTQKFALEHEVFKWMNVLNCI